MRSIVRLVWSACDLAEICHAGDAHSCACMCDGQRRRRNVRPHPWSKQRPAALELEVALETITCSWDRAIRLTGTVHVSMDVEHPAFGCSSGMRGDRATSGECNHQRIQRRCKASVHRRLIRSVEGWPKLTRKCGSGRTLGRWIVSRSVVHDEVLRRKTGTEERTGAMKCGQGGVQRRWGVYETSCVSKLCRTAVFKCLPALKQQHARNYV